MALDKSGNTGRAGKGGGGRRGYLKCLSHLDSYQSWDV